jgi:hypothetical protein
VRSAADPAQRNVAAPHDDGSASAMPAPGDGPARPGPSYHRDAPARIDVAAAATLLARARQHHPLAPWLQSGLRVTGSVYEGPYSRVFHVDRPGSPTGLALKVCLDAASGAPDCASAEHQFRKLRDGFDSMRRHGGPYRIPEPVALIAAEAAIVMEWAPGETFAAVLNQKTRPAAELIAIACAAGLWLRQFHDAGPSVLGLADDAALRSEIDPLPTRLRADRPFHQAMRAALLSATRALPALRAVPLQTTWLHGDWQPANVIIGQNGVYGLDISCTRRGFALADAAHMASHLARFPCLPKGWRRLPARRALVWAFVASYLGRPPGRQEWLALHWFELLDQIHFFLRYDGREPTRLRNLYLGGMQAALVASACRRMEALIGA